MIVCLFVYHGGDIMVCASFFLIFKKIPKHGSYVSHLILSARN